MNEFTKEELTLMYHNFAETEFRGTNAKLETIRTKIRSLIDNYSVCNHKKIVTGAYPRSNPPKKCEECGVLYYE